MTHTAFRSLRQLVVALLIFICQLASAQVPSSAARAAMAQISATYQVQQRTSLGARQQILMRIHLINRGRSMLSIRRITLWQSRPERGTTRSAAILLAPHASADVVQQFTVGTRDYQMWRRGAPPKLMMQIVGPRNTSAKTLVRLDRAAQEVN